MALLHTVTRIRARTLRSAAVLITIGAMALVAGLVARAAGPLSMGRSVFGAGGGTAVGPTLRVRSTLGTDVVGVTSSAAWTVRAGFWGPHVAEVSGVPEDGDLPPPPRFALDQNTPNPFNPRTTIRYELPHATRVTLRIYDARGRLVRTLVDEEQKTGAQRAVWDGTDDRGHGVASGTYIYRLRASSATLSRKMVLLQ